MKHDQDLQNTDMHSLNAHENDELTGLMHQFMELEKRAREANESLRNYLGATSTQEMIMRINELKLPEKARNILYAGIVLDTDDEDISTLVEEIRKRNAIGQADDVVDHLNYTAL